MAQFMSNITLTLPALRELERLIDEERKEHAQELADCREHLTDMGGMLADIMGQIAPLAELVEDDRIGDETTLEAIGRLLTDEPCYFDDLDMLGDTIVTIQDQEKTIRNQREAIQDQRKAVQDLSDDCQELRATVEVLEECLAQQRKVNQELMNAMESNAKRESTAQKPKVAS